MANKNKSAVAEAPKALPITLESNVGKCQFGISVTGFNESNVATFCRISLGYHLWHKVQSLMFAGGKKAVFTSKSPYSPELQAHALKVASEELAKYFAGVEISVSEYVEESDESKFYKACKAIGMSEDSMKAAWTTAQAEKAKTEAKPAEQTSENTLE